MIDCPQRKAKVIAALNEISPEWACGMAVKNANSANSQNLTGEGRSLTVSRTSNFQHTFNRIVANGQSGRGGVFFSGKDNRP